MTDQDKPGGVYFIVNLLNGKHYVGSTANLTKREKDHRYTLAAGRHSNRKLQNAWNKHGADAFRFDVIERLPDAVLLTREQFWIDGTLPFYNICRIANSRLGVKSTDETRAKISASKMNPSADTRAKIAAANRNRSPETLAKMSDSHKGHSPSVETRAKIGAAGKNRSAESLDKTRQSSTGRLHTDEAKAKMSRAHKGKTISDEQRAKLRAANLGKTIPEATKEKMRISRQKWLDANKTTNEERKAS